MAKVKFPSEMPSANNIGGNDKMMIAKEGTGETYQATFDQAKQYLTITSIEMQPVAPGALPAGPVGQTRYMEVTAVGTWTYGGSPVGSNAEGFKTTFWWTGSTWVNNGSVRVKGDPGANGLDGEMLAKNWDSAKVGGYTANQTAIKSGVIYRVKSTVIGGVSTDPEVDSGDEPTKNWEILGSKEVISESINIFEWQDKDGKIVAFIDKDGNFVAKFKDDTFTIDKVSNLTQKLLALENTTIIESDGVNLFEFTDSTGKIIASITKDGELFVDKIRSKNISSSTENNGSTGGLEFTKERFVHFPNVDFFDIYMSGGFFPTSAQGVVEWNAIIRINGADVLKCYIDVERQGAGTATAEKGNYTFDFKNADRQSLVIKFNDLVQTDSYHFKGYHTDITHLRDLGNGQLYLDMIRTRPFPQNMHMPLLNTLESTYNANFTNIGGVARFVHSGVNCAIHANGEFYGLYTCRLKKTRENYAVDNNNPNHIFIDSQLIGAKLGENTYTSYDDVIVYYEMRSPKSSAITQTTKDNVMRFFDYARGVQNSTVDLAATYSEYFDLIAWLDFIIICELINHHDTISNNAAYITYDGLIWKPILIDTDRTIGIGSLTNINLTSTNRPLISRDIFQKIAVQFEPQLKARYTYLRNSGIISSTNFQKIYGGLAGKIPQTVYKADADKWGSSMTNALPTLNQLLYFINDRMAQYDALWMV